MLLPGNPPPAVGLSGMILSLQESGLITRSLRPYLLSALLSLPGGALQANELPALGNSASGYVSLQQEHELGRLWLRQLRAQATVIDDPLATQFLEDLMYRLIPHSEVQISDFEFVIVDRRELNAFAVPGGIIGIHFGIFLHTRDEDELSGVLAHELAHLSQRHFARQLEQADRQGPLAIASLLASILLMVAGSPDAGFAGLIGTQAASIQSQLAYSRDWEREADRLGMKTLAAAGLDPYAMPSMFQRMLQASRFNERPPEFLLTHPVTESRIADAADRAQQYPQQPRLSGYEFRILQNLAQVRYQLRGDQQQTHFSETLKHHPRSSTEHAAALYTLARLQLEQQPARALETLQQIPSPWRDHSATVALRAQALQATGQADAALKAINEALPFSPTDYNLLMTRARLLESQNKAAEAVLAWRRLTELRPGEPAIWQALGSAAAANQQSALAYRANAEALFYRGQHAQALQQMGQAVHQAADSDDFQQEAALKQRQQVMANTPSRF